MKNKEIFDLRKLSYNLYYNRDDSVDMVIYLSNDNDDKASIDIFKYHIDKYNYPCEAFMEWLESECKINKED